MKCPVCKAEMEKGSLVNLFWKKGEQHFIGLGKFTNPGAKYTFAFRCPKCGKIELMSEVDDKKEDKKI